MPIYVYQAAADGGCDHCRNGFEKLQKLRDDPLSQCPHCLGPVTKVVSAPNLASAGADLSEKNIEQHGFTQYRKVEKGVYEKTAGKGPGLLSDKD